MFLQVNRRLELYGFVSMLNHLHLIVKAGDVSACMRDFKRYTSKQIRVSIKNKEPEVLDLFMADNKFHLWKIDSQPRLIENEKFYLEKLHYIHNNPVKKGYLEKPQCWKWSSANPHCGLTCNTTI